MVLIQVDPAEWRLEVERVAPRLKITVASNARDWRSHLDEAHKHSQEIGTLWPGAQAALGAVQTEVSVTLVPCSSHRFLNESTCQVEEDRVQLIYSAGLAAAHKFHLSVQNIVCLISGRWHCQPIMSGNNAQAVS